MTHPCEAHGSDFCKKRTTICRANKSILDFADAIAEHALPAFNKLGEIATTFADGLVEAKKRCQQRY